MRPLHALSCCVLVSAALGCSALDAQTSAPIPRITEQVDENSLVTLPGNVPFLARAQYDRGGIPADSSAVSTDTLTASYSGDSNYNSATGAATVNVTSAATGTGTYTITVTGKDISNSNIAASATLTLTVN
jgi:hypothetical protein